MKTASYKLPTIAELASLIVALKKDIGDDYRADEFDDSDTPSMSVTVGANAAGQWNYQTGDNSFTGGAYGFSAWAVVTIDRRSNSREIAADIRDQLAELLHEETYEARQAEKTALRSAGLA